MPIRANETAKGPQATSLRILVGLAIALAVVGAAIAALLLARGGSGTAGNVMGQPVETSFGSFTVTNVQTTFVPDTQGPPTAAQHDGTKGTSQLQVWVRLVNDRAESGLAFAPAQLRLVTDARSGSGQSPDGSLIKEATMLPRGGGIDGQVWFDLPKVGQSTGTGWFLEFKDPGGDPVRVAIDTPRSVLSPAGPSPSTGQGADSHPHDDSAGKH